MKIGIIHPILDLLGGAERTTIALSDELKKQKNETTLYSLTKTPVETSNNFHVKIIKGIPFGRFGRGLKIFDIKRLYSAAKDEDVLVIMDGGFAYVCVPEKKTIVYCNSTFESDYDFATKKLSGISAIAFRIIQKELQKNISDFKEKKPFLIATSEYTRQKLKTLFDMESAVIYPPVDITSFTCLTEKSKNKNVICISRYAKNKNIEFLVDVAKKGNFNFEMIGNFNKFESGIYDKIKKKTENDNNIRLHHDLSQRAIKEKLLSSKVYFHSAKETFGISVVESIAAGCIPIVPDNSAHPETVPIKDLRYGENDLNDAKEKIVKALNGEFDHFLPSLKSHIQQFDKSIFQRKMHSYIENLA